MAQWAKYLPQSLTTWVLPWYPHIGRRREPSLQMCLLMYTYAMWHPLNQHKPTQVTHKHSSNSKYKWQRVEDAREDPVREERNSADVIKIKWWRVLHHPVHSSIPSLPFFGIGDWSGPPTLLKCFEYQIVCKSIPFCLFLCLGSLGQESEVRVYAWCWRALTMGTVAQSEESAHVVSTQLLTFLQSSHLLSLCVLSGLWCVLAGKAFLLCVHVVPVYRHVCTCVCRCKHKCVCVWVCMETCYLVHLLCTSPCILRQGLFLNLTLMDLS